MKKLLVIVTATTLFLSACNKKDVQQPAAVNATPSSEATLSAKATSKTAALTAHSWMYQGYYFHYIDQQHKGDAQYVRGSNNNIINLDDTRIAYKSNGTFLELDGGFKYPGTWKFTDAADTALSMAYSWGTDVNTIITLNNNHLNFDKSIGRYSHGNFAYTELIPAQ
jgi:opacity protein-like surface antigen